MVILVAKSSGKGRQPPTLSSSGLEPRQSISGQIADRLRADILSAAIGPDQPLKQDHIARRFGVSQAPVREALKQLVSERLVVAQVNRGVRVAPLDRNEVEETAALRLRLELDLIESAATNFKVEDVERAAKVLNAISGETGVSKLMRANDEFHEIIYRPANRPVTASSVRLCSEGRLIQLR